LSRRTVHRIVLPPARDAVDPSPLAEGPPRVGVASLSNAPLAAPLPTRVLTGREPQIAHELSGILKEPEVAQFGTPGNRHGELHAAQGLNRLDHRGPAPRFGQGLEFRFQALQALLMFRNRPDVLLEHDLLAGVGQTTAASQRRCAGLQVARPSYRMS